MTSEAKENKVLIVIIMLLHYIARGMRKLSNVFFLSVILTELTSDELSVTYKAVGDGKVNDELLAKCSEKNAER